MVSIILANISEQSLSPKRYRRAGTRAGPDVDAQEQSLVSGSIVASTLRTNGTFPCPSFIMLFQSSDDRLSSLVGAAALRIHFIEHLEVVGK